MLTISALFLTIIHVLFRLPFVLFVRFVVEFGIAGASRTYATPQF
jgi:hypothetical protein